MAPIFHVIYIMWKIQNQLVELADKIAVYTGRAVGADTVYHELQFSRTLSLYLAHQDSLVHAFLAHLALQFLPRSAGAYIE